VTEGSRVGPERSLRLRELEAQPGSLRSLRGGGIARLL
jgi:hypothetical protein